MANGSPYRLVLTDEDLRIIRWAGDRYSWSSTLLNMKEGTNLLREHEAWTLAQAFDEDTEGGHGMFPCLDPESRLYSELSHLRGHIV